MIAILRNPMVWILLASTIMAFMLVGYGQSTGLIVDSATAYANSYDASARQAAMRCSGAQALINSAEYDSGSGTLRVQITSKGQTSMSFYGFLTYKNGTVMRYPSVVRDMAPGSTGTFEMQGVDPSLDQVTIQSMECMSAQDLLHRSDIQGMD